MKCEILVYLSISNLVLLHLPLLHTVLFLLGHGKLGLLVKRLLELLLLGKLLLLLIKRLLKLLLHHAEILLVGVHHHTIGHLLLHHAGLLAVISCSDSWLLSIWY